MPKKSSVSVVICRKATCENSYLVLFAEGMQPFCGMSKLESVTLPAGSCAAALAEGAVLSR